LDQLTKVVTKPSMLREQDDVWWQQALEVFPR